MPVISKRARSWRTNLEKARCKKVCQQRTKLEETLCQDGLDSNEMNTEDEPSSIATVSVPESGQNRIGTSASLLMDIHHPNVAPQQLEYRGNTSEQVHIVNNPNVQTPKRNEDIYEPKTWDNEQCWGYAERVYREVPRAKREGKIKINMIKSLDSVPLESIRKFWNRSLRFIDAYRRGLNGQQAAWAARKYHSHRVLPATIMQEIEEEIQRTQGKSHLVHGWSTRAPDSLRAAPD